MAGERRLPPQGGLGGGGEPRVRHGLDEAGVQRRRHRLGLDGLHPVGDGVRGLLTPGRKGQGRLRREKGRATRNRWSDDGCHSHGLLPVAWKPRWRCRSRSGLTCALALGGAQPWAGLRRWLPRDDGLRDAASAPLGSRRADRAAHPPPRRPRLVLAQRSVGAVGRVRRLEFDAEFGALARAASKSCWAPSAWAAWRAARSALPGALSAQAPGHRSLLTGTWASLRPEGT